MSLYENISEQSYLHDLDIPHYMGKWRCAVEFATKQFEIGSFEWYMAARKHYLELGGCYVHERTRGAKQP